MFLGAHCSAAGGVSKAIERAEACGCEALQIFTRQPSRWESPPLKETEIQAFRKGWAKTGIQPSLSHAAYLINLCAPSPKNQKGLIALRDELERCEALGVQNLVLHPGARLTLSIDEALKNAAQALTQTLKKTRGFSVRILLENTAGQGSYVGHQLSEIETLLEKTNDPEGRLGVCLDTCHAFAAGYPLHTASGYTAFFEEVQQRFGFALLYAFHLNDAQKDFFSRIDRHAPLGRGTMTLFPFWKLLQDDRFSEKVAVLETPPLPGKELHESFRLQLRELRQLSQQPSPPPMHEERYVQLSLP